MPKYVQYLQSGYVHTESYNPFLKEQPGIKQVPENSPELLGTTFDGVNFIKPAVIIDGEEVEPERIVYTIT